MQIIDRRIDAHPPLGTAGVASSSSLRLLLLCASLLAGCSTHDGARPSSAGLPAVTPLMLPPQISADVAPAVAGRLWAWQGTDQRDGTRVASPAGERYTLEFMQDGRVLVRADCNRGSGRYAITADNRLTISAVATTKMGCPAGSKDTEFLRDLANVQAYRFDGPSLWLMFANDAGAMRFGPMPQ